METSASQWIAPVMSTSVIGVVVVAVLVKVLRMYKTFTFFQNLPGSDNFSLLMGNIHEFPKDPAKRIEYDLQEMEKYGGKFYRVWFGPITPVIAACHPETVKTVLQSSAPKSRGFGGPYELVLGWIGEGLITTNGPRWARSRRLLTPAFHFDILKDYMQVYNEAAENLFIKMDKLAETGESFDVAPLITLCTLEVIMKCALSYDADVQGRGHPYSEAVTDLAHIFAERLRRPWLYPHWIFGLTSMGKKFNQQCDYVHRVAEEVIEKRKQSLEKDGVPKGRRLDFIDILLTAKDDDGNTMTSLEIRNEVDTFMFAGHDTTASAFSWFLFTLAQHPEYQEKIKEEVDSVLEGRDSEEILWEDLPKLETLALCAKEAIRLYTAVPWTARQLNEDVEMDGHKIPAGTRVVVGHSLLHRNPLVWDEPNEFRPERFLVENKKSMDSFAFVPFSAGSRNCIGQNFALNEEKVLISRVLRRYKVRVAKDHELPVGEPAAILRPVKGIWLTLQKR